MIAYHVRIGERRFVKIPLLDTAHFFFHAAEYLSAWSEELPRDILDNLIEEIKPLLPLVPCGELEVEAREKRAATSVLSHQ
jgi:hypothetical protein